MEAKMKKISMFMLMIFGAFILFAQEAPKEEPKNEANEPVKAEAPAEAQPAEAQPEAAQPAEQQNAEAQPAETPAQEEQKPAEVETPAQEEQKPAETQPEEQEAPAQMEQEPSNAPQPYVNVYSKQQKVEYYRPYLGAGVPLIVIGSVSFIIMMPAMGTMAFAASDACEGKDWDFCEELHDNNKKHHTAWTVGSVMTGVVGASMIAVGSWLTSIEKPKNMPVEVSGFSILPSKKGMVASVGLKF